MSNGSASRDERPDTDRRDLPELMVALMDCGELELVPTASGEVLYVLQSRDE
jgi:hypothetical protein